MTLSDFNVVVVGAGFFGTTVARRLACDFGLPVLLIEKRAHVGGNAYSKIDPETGIEYHLYGSHIFHTSSTEVWDFITRFTRFNEYRHRVLTTHKGRVYPMPINLMTINTFFEKSFSPAEAKAFLAGEISRERLSAPSNFEEKVISLIGRSLYDALIRGYTQKQWEADPRELPPEIIARLPLRLNYDSFYFSDTFEGIPIDGYAAVFHKILRSDKIKVVTNCDYFAIRSQLSPRALTVYTGPVDAYYDFRFGVLGWRTLDLQVERLPIRDFQGTAVMNYADLDVDFTRIHEFKHYHPERKYACNKTLIMYEYSRTAGRDDEPYYPVNLARDKLLYDRYREQAEREGQTVFGGRLGSYRYIDMHQAIGAALRAVPNEIVPRLKRLGHL
jgi:UDP-galactopyranose mutase